MIARDPVLQEFINSISETVNTTTGHYQRLKDQFEKDRYISGTNGDEPRLVKDVVRDTHADVQEIKRATEIFIDFSKIYRILKKYKKIRWSLTTITLASTAYGLFFR